jgi:hypothetical protein
MNDKFALSQLSTDFLQAMARSMYKFECAIATIETIDKLMSEEELFEFYRAYMNQPI